MKKFQTVALTVSLILTFFSLSSAQEKKSHFTPLKAGSPGKLSSKMKKIIDTRIKILERIASNPVIINAVKKQNAEDLSIEKIRSIDEGWKAGGKEEFANSLLENMVGKFLRKKLKSNKMLYTEAFLCDKKGAIVGEYPKTSDYWQGDEIKFSAAFNGGKGKVFIGPLQFDDSTQSTSVQVSVPVNDNKGTIGVLVMGLRNIK